MPVSREPDGDIIMLHDTPPRGGNTREGRLLEVDRLHSGIGEKGFRILPLSELIGRSVMREIA